MKRKQGDIVLDPMSGSGTTARVAAETGRNYIGIDISHEYCELARKRVKLIEMYPVSSSNISEVGYDSQTEIVLIRFLNNTLYVYKCAPETVFDELRTAVNRHLRQAADSYR